MSKKDRSQEVAALSNNMIEVLEEIVLQVKVFDKQANQLRVTTQPKQYAQNRVQTPQENTAYKS